MSVQPSAEALNWVEAMASRIGAGNVSATFGNLKRAPLAAKLRHSSSFLREA